MHDRDVRRKVNFEDIPDEKIKSIKVPTVIIIIWDKDFITPEHALEMHRNIANSQLAIIPGRHEGCIGEITTLKHACKETDFVLPMIEKFLSE